MSLLSGFQVEKQKADDTINVVCDRLEHATLLQDRRAAVLSLRGFSREYKESVAAGGLRGLLKSLSIDRDDDETLNATLDCLLTLFTIDEGGRVDDTALWIADEFTLRPENVQNLLEIVSATSFYARLHALQILASILECRGPQLQDCVMNSATGTNAIVNILDERREQLRNEGLFLLLRLVRGHPEIQKRVAFENAFEKVFAIINEEGGLHGGIVASDCFTLLHNLLAGNISNQNWFRETEFFRSINELLSNLDKESSFSTALNRNIIAILEIVRLFVPQSSKLTSTNQNAIMKSGSLTQIIGLAFCRSVPQSICAEALLASADLIRNNKALQAYFTRASVMASFPVPGAAQASEDMSALFAIIVDEGNHGFEFGTRLAASSCLQAFVSGNDAQKLDIVRKIIDDYLSPQGGKLLENMLDVGSSDDQLRSWFATCTLLHLTHEDEEAKKRMTDLVIGDATVGEEEVSLIQTISAKLIETLQNSKMRIAAAYIMLLSSWLFDSKENVADFLEESSTLQVLICSVQADETSDLMKGLICSLLSICYAFDFAETTPVNRSALQDILLRLGRDSIVGSIVTFSYLDDFRPEQQPIGGMHKPVLDGTYVDFFRDNYGLIRKAVDLPPNPPRSKREEEAQEEAERTEDIIADLESELERKSSGLDEAIIIIKTRQEELQRLREEIKYIHQKHEAELKHLSEDMNELRRENKLLKDEATHNSNEIDKSLREQAVIHSRLTNVVREFDQCKGALDVARANAERLDSEVESEASKRSFLEKELASLKTLTSVTGEELSASRTILEDSRAQITQLIAGREALEHQLNGTDMELAAARAGQIKAEQDAALARTRARDIKTDLEGIKHELDTSSISFEKQISEERTLTKGTQEKLATLELEHQSVIEKLQDIESGHQISLDELKRTQKEHEVELVQVISELKIELNAERDRARELENQLEKAKSIARSALTAPAKIDSASQAAATEIHAELRHEIDRLTSEKADLQKQLEQAQEDLMLIMEDEA